MREYYLASNHGLASLSRHTSYKICKLIRWILLDDGWLKVNTNAAVCNGFRNALASGLICGKHERYIAGFSKNIGCCSVITTKLWGALEGLQLASNLGLERVILEMDSTKAIQVIQTTEADQQYFVVCEPSRAYSNFLGWLGLHISSERAIGLLMVGFNGVLKTIG
ncbi:hypothetical protein J1N35_030161 [Gossypium stocksii]|uniref:RNase H type-1 domain-containing protein n=1 Tax=Gossypium stocksii TaxID=47602 RepID=A0A9D3V0F8_9ROSI|nr:hypothetical protein J1N35_030161 [Gossypium stocksii]